MKTTHLLRGTAAFVLAASAAAQAPNFYQLPSTATPMDVTTAGGTTLVAGADGSNAFLWTPAGGTVTIGAIASGSNVRLSTDGQTVVADTVGLDGIKRASYWRVSTGWVQIPGLGGSSGGTETSVYNVDADGTVIVGLGWVVGGGGHAFRHDTTTGITTDLTPPFSSPSSRANDVDGSGSFVVGWHDTASGSRWGARWLNGVKTYFTYVDPSNVSYNVGEALAANRLGTVVVGYNVFGLAGMGWRWDSATNAITLLPNLTGQTGTPLPGDVTDDGTMVVGSNGGAPFGRLSILWLEGQPPQSLFTYYQNLGANFGLFTDLGTPTAISRDGRVVVGRGSGAAFSQPLGWVIELPQAGTPFCAGDGIATDHTTPCPCANNGGLGRGCANSANAQGAKLATTGFVTTDDVVLGGSGMPATVACIYLQGDALSDTTFGDGVRCAGGTLLRLRTKINVGGASSFPDSVETITLSQRGGVAPGAGVRRYYQAYYRNAAAAFCPPETYNVSNGVYIDW